MLIRKKSKLHTYVYDNHDKVLSMNSIKWMWQTVRESFIMSFFDDLKEKGHDLIDDIKEKKDEIKEHIKEEIEEFAEKSLNFVGQDGK